MRLPRLRAGDGNEQMRSAHSMEHWNGIVGAKNWRKSKRVAPMGRCVKSTRSLWTTRRDRRVGNAHQGTWRRSETNRKTIVLTAIKQTIRSDTFHLRLSQHILKICIEREMYQIFQCQLLWHRRQHHPPSSLLSPLSSFLSPLFSLYPSPSPLPLPRMLNVFVLHLRDRFRRPCRRLIRIAALKRNLAGCNFCTFQQLLIGTDTDTAITFSALLLIASDRCPQTTTNKRRVNTSRYRQPLTFHICCALISSAPMGRPNQQLTGTIACHQCKCETSGMDSIADWRASGVSTLPVSSKWPRLVDGSSLMIILCGIIDPDVDIFQWKTVSLLLLMRCGRWDAAADEMLHQHPIISMHPDGHTSPTTQPQLAATLGNRIWINLIGPVNQLTSHSVINRPSYNDQC